MGAIVAIEMGAGEPAGKPYTGAPDKEAPMVGLFQNFGLPEILIILAVLLLLFGARKLPELARSLGRSSNEFRRGLKEGSKDLDEDEEEDEGEQEKPAEKTRSRTTKKPSA
jgi:sec-independent protein translocase protein TatA